MDNPTERTSVNTILVLTELNKSAKIAAEYALTLAMDLNTNLLLFNSYLIQASPFEQIPLQADIQTRTVEQLQNEVKRLQTILSCDKPSFCPEIFYINEEGNMTDNIFNVLEKESVIMIVKGSQFEHDEDDLLDTDMINVLRKVRLPILIVPEYASPISHE